jgi:protein-tyrosine-phosphatase
MGLLRRRLAMDGKEDWRVTSAGTWAQWKRGAAQNSIRVMEAQGIDIRDHQARLVTEEMMADADLILCMETGHAEALRAEFPAMAKKVHLLSEMVGRQYSISDPYGSPLPEYERMATDISEIIDEGYDRIVELAQANAGLTNP